MLEVLINVATHLIAYVGGLATGIFVLYRIGEDEEERRREKMLEE